MTIPAGIVGVLLLASFILSALSYYRLDPARRLLSKPFVLLAAPALVLIAFQAARIGNVASPLASWLAFALAVGLLVPSIRQARCLLAKTKPG